MDVVLFKHSTVDRYKRLNLIDFIIIGFLIGMCLFAAHIDDGRLR